jgi:hypothetical protein
LASSSGKKARWLEAKRLIARKLSECHKVIRGYIGLKNFVFSRDEY